LFLVGFYLKFNDVFVLKNGIYRFYASEKTIIDKAARQIINGTYELSIEALIPQDLVGTVVTVLSGKRGKLMKL